MTGAHRLPAAVFDAIAAGAGGPPAVGALRATTRSKHLLLLRGVMDLAASRDSRERGGLEAGYELLTMVEARSRDAVTEVLSSPHFGAWAAACIRRLHRTGTGTVPLRTDLGHLAAAAAAAAIRAGAEFEIAVPLRGGALALPTLGRATLEPLRAGDGDAVVRSSGTRTEVTAGRSSVVLPADWRADTQGWRALRRLHSETAGRRIELVLDDTDPFRASRGVPAAPALDADAVRAWRQTLGAAWSLLARDHPYRAEEIAAGLVALVPLTSTPNGTSSAASSEAFGAVASALPADRVRLAETLAHEFQHVKLGALLGLLTLYEPRGEERYYAPWRGDPRPVGGLFQGAYAFLGVTDFWRVHRTVTTGDDAARAQFRFARWRAATWHATEQLLASGRLTEPGRSFVGGMRATLGAWMDEPVPIGPARMAREAAADHWHAWQARNARAATTDTTRLVWISPLETARR